MPESEFIRTNTSPISPESLVLIGFFFFNIFLLPAGLLYTTLLTPLFVLLLLKKRKWKILALYALISILFAYQHVADLLDKGAYLKSYVLFSSAVIFTIWVYDYLLENKDKLGYYFKQLTIYNTAFVILAIIGWSVPMIRELMWYDVPIHPAIPAFSRLRLLMYEPSFYSFQLAPVFLFYFTSYVFDQANRYATAFVLLAIALVLSLSFGVLAGMVVSILIVFLSHAFVLLKRKRVFFATLYLTLLAGIGLFILWHFFPFNPVVDRVEKIVAGHDNSTNGRTWEAFLLAWRILGETDYLWGAGWGQIKVVGQPIIVEYYNYEGEWRDLVRIPNAMAETLASLGLIGAIGRLVAEIGLFFYSKVYQNYYRLILFTFLFIFQFMGSYLTNIYEYLMWVMVFLPIFPQFDKTRFV